LMAMIESLMGMVMEQRRLTLVPTRLNRGRPLAHTRLRPSCESSNSRLRWRGKGSEETALIHQIKACLLTKRYFRGIDITS